MKIVSRTKSNNKGQITIPKKIRDYLGIRTNITLILSIHDKSLLVSPIEKPTIAQNQVYLEILKRTQGGWAHEASSNPGKRKLELKASKNRKLAW